MKYLDLVSTPGTSGLKNWSRERKRQSFDNEQLKKYKSTEFTVTEGCWAYAIVFFFDRHGDKILEMIWL